MSKPKWTRDGECFLQKNAGYMWSLSWVGRKTTHKEQERNAAFDELLADANWAAENRAEHERVLAEHGRMVAAIKGHRDGHANLGLCPFSEGHPWPSCGREHRALLDAAGLPDEEPAEPGPSNEELREQTGKMLAACEGVLGVLNKIEKGEDA